MSFYDFFQDINSIIDFLIHSKLFFISFSVFFFFSCVHYFIRLFSATIKVNVKIESDSDKKVKGFNLDDF